MPSQRSDRSGDDVRAGEIEFLPPDDRVFGPADERTFAGLDDWWPDDELDDAAAAPRSRWATALAGLGVAGILALGVVTAAPWSSDDARGPVDPTPTVPVSAPESVTSPTSPVSPVPSTFPPTRPAVDPTRTGWIIDPLPDGLRGLQYLSTAGDTAAGGGWGEVWAEPGASRTGGRWFSLTLFPFRELDPGAPAWFPVDVAGRDGIADVGPDGVVSLAYDAGLADAARLITIEAFGFTVTQLVELADSIGIIDDRPQLVDDRPEFLRPELLDGLVQIAAEPTDSDLTTRAVLGRGAGSIVFYGDGGPWDVTLVQEQLDVGPSDDRLLALSLNRFLVDPATFSAPPGFEGAELVVGSRTIGSYPLVVARWSANGRTLSVMSSRGFDATLALVPAVRFADADEWASLERQRAPRSPDVGRTAPGVTVASGALADGREYSVLHWASSDELELRVGRSSAFQPTGEQPLRVFTLDGVSLVVALTSEPAAALTVTSADGALTVPVVELSRRATDGTVRTSYLSVVALPDRTAVAPFAAEIVIPTGEVVARLAPWGGGVVP